jgi:subtilisin family serine protease
MSGVRVAVVDSGVHAGHPHVGGIEDGIGFDALGRAHADCVDRLGHGTAVAAVIREKAPGARLIAVKVFDHSLRTEIGALLAALDWAAERRVELVNLSLGTSEARHETALGNAVEAAVAAGVLIVSAIAPEGGPPLLPGALLGVLPVELDWTCPRDEVLSRRRGDGTWVCAASGYPRPIPGVPPERNLKGQSFAVANVTGVLAAIAGARAAENAGARPDVVAGRMSLEWARAALEARAAAGLRAASRVAPAE